MGTINRAGKKPLPALQHDERSGSADITRAKGLQDRLLTLREGEKYAKTIHQRSRSLYGL
jgi:hypothetical protein